MALAEDIAAVLARTALFGTLGVADIAACAREFTEVRYAQGETIFARGDAGDSLIVVAEGRVRLSVMAEDGRELSVRHAAAGSLLGEIAALDGGPRTADAAAIAPVRAFSIARMRLLALAAAIPELSQGFILLLCKRLRDTTDQLEGIALHSVEERLARFLLVSLAGRTAPAGKRVPLEIEFSQGELAQLLGASRPKANMALGALEKAGAVKRTADRLFCDPALLAKHAGVADG